ISAVKTAYYQVLARKSALEAARQNMELAGDFLSKAELRVKAGEGTRLEQLTAKVQNSEVLVNLNLKENELKSGLLELSYAMGMSSGSIQALSLSDTLLSDPVKLSFEELYKTALECSPQLKINELRVNSAAADRKLAWTSLLPNFNLSYYKMTRDGERGFYGASFGVTVPLWFMFDQRSRIKESAANENAASADLLNAKNDLYLKLNRSFNDYQNALKQVELYKYEILPLSEEVYQTALRNYEAGEISYLEFLQAKQTSVSAQYDYIDVLLSYNKSVVALEETIGKRIK
ncbi:MAG: TolC family protein, partial [Syntrophothermus sp.]